MKYLICGILGIAIGFFVFYLLFRIANKDKLCKKLQDGSKKETSEAELYKTCIGRSPFYLLCGFVYRYQSNTYRLFTIRGACHIHSNPDYYSNCLVLLESQGRKHYQNQKGIPGGNKGYFC